MKLLQLHAKEGEYTIPVSAIVGGMFESKPSSDAVQDSNPTPLDKMWREIWKVLALQIEELALKALFWLQRWPCKSVV